MNVELWLLFVSAATARNTGSMRSTPHQAAAVQQQSRQQLCRQHPRKTIHCEDGCRHCSVRHSHVICRKFEWCMLQLVCLVTFCSITKEHVAPHTEALLTNLFQGLSSPNEENEYVMKCEFPTKDDCVCLSYNGSCNLCYICCCVGLMRSLSLMQELIVPVIGDIVTQLTQILMQVSKVSQLILASSSKWTESYWCFFHFRIRASLTSTTTCSSLCVWPSRSRARSTRKWLRRSKEGSSLRFRKSSSKTYKVMHFDVSAVWKCRANIGSTLVQSSFRTSSKSCRFFWRCTPAAFLSPTWRSSPSYSCLSSGNDSVTSHLSFDYCKPTSRRGHNRLKLQTW